MNASLPINAPDDDALLARAEALAWRDDGASLPAVLMRPSLDGAVGRWIIPSRRIRSRRHGRAGKSRARRMR
jgi:hypothetical protein